MKMAKENWNKKDGFSYQSVSRELKNAPPQRLYLLHGREDYLLERFVEELICACLPEGADDFSLRELNGAATSLQELADSVNALPFATERTLTIVRGYDLNHVREVEYKTFEAIVSDVPDYATLAFINRGADEPDGRLKAVKLLRKLGRDIDFCEQSGSTLNNWIRRRFAALGRDIEPEACEALVYASGSLMGALVPEIEKIAAGTASERVTAADVEALAFRIPETRAFDMTDAISARDFDTAARLLGDLFDMGEEPLKVLGAVGYNMRRLYAARLAAEYRAGDEYIKRVTGVKYDFVLKKLKASASRYSLAGLRRAVELCAETDYAIKSSYAGDTELLGELLARFAVECA